MKSKLKSGKNPASKDALADKTEWLLKRFDGPSREVKFRVLSATGQRDARGAKIFEGIHTEPIATCASDEILVNSLKGQVAELQQVENWIAFVKQHGNSSNSSPAVKMFSLHIRDLHTDSASNPVTILGQATDTAESFREKLVNYIKDAVKSKTSSIYQAMVAEVERRGWHFTELRRGTMARARWRELCFCHPLWMTDLMTETERTEFARVSHDTIFKNLETGRYKSTVFSHRTRTTKRLSRKQPDVPHHVRKRSSRPKQES